MWDTVHDLSETGRSAAPRHLSHDLPCLSCGHAAHTYLACDAVCECLPSAMPGMLPLGITA